jgi:hypothetical protein
MEHHQKTRKLNNGNPKQIIGVKRKAFETMADILKREYTKI